LSVNDIGATGQPAAAVKAALSKAFRPGQFFQDMANAGVTFAASRDDVLTRITAAASQHFAGEFASC
jgi:hypothetical protein